MSSTTTHQSCIVCGSKSLKELKGYSQPQLVKCKDCSMVFCHSVPSEMELNDYYKNYGRTEFISPVTIKRYNEWLDEFEIYRKSGNMLDIGCGNGFFLTEAKRRGWNVYGTEYSAQLVEACKEKGISMIQGALNREMFGGISFDVITSIEVIEHIHNQQAEMPIITAKLRQGGLFFCTTPNFNALSRFFLKSQYNIISYPEHLAYFTPKTLTALMHEYGLMKKRVLTTGISITRFNQSTGRKQQRVVSASSDDELLRGKIESRWYLQWLKYMLNAIFVVTRTGYSLKGWFVKE